MPYYYDIVTHYVAFFQAMVHYGTLWNILAHYETLSQTMVHYGSSRTQQVKVFSDNVLMLSSTCTPASLQVRNFF